MLSKQPDRDLSKAEEILDLIEVDLKKKIDKEILARKHFALEEKWKGTVLYNLFCLLAVGMTIAAKILFERHKELEAEQFLFGRSVFAFVFILLAVNKDLPAAMWT